MGGESGKLNASLLAIFFPIHNLKNVGKLALDNMGIPYVYSSVMEVV